MIRTQPDPYLITRSGGTLPEPQLSFDENGMKFLTEKVDMDEKNQQLKLLALRILCLTFHIGGWACLALVFLVAHQSTFLLVTSIVLINLTVLPLVLADSKYSFLKRLFSQLDDPEKRIEKCFTNFEWKYLRKCRDLYEQKKLHAKEASEAFGALTNTPRVGDIIGDFLAPGFNIPIKNNIPAEALQIT